MSSVFTKILRGEIPGIIVHEDDRCAVIRDIQPQAPQHLLIFPKKELVSLAQAEEADSVLLGHLLVVAAKVARQLGLSENGFRLVVNTGDHGGQTVPHLHMHLLGGRHFQWPPG